MAAPLQKNGQEVATFSVPIVDLRRTLLNIRGHSHFVPRLSSAEIGQNVDFGT
jgi:hypothetical protein